MRLRAEPPRVTRLSRKVLAGLGLFASVGIGGALIYALQTRDAGRPNEEDRKSVLSGKSVSVRVDLGGRRIIKKQKTVTKNLQLLNLIKHANTTTNKTRHRTPHKQTLMNTQSAKQI